VLRRISSGYRLHLLLIGIWMIVGATVRFIHLTTKPLWADEFSTIVFSLGHSFRTVPLNQILTMGDVLQPLAVNPSTQIGAVIEHLMAESTHPPLYFVLAHGWMQLFSPSDGLVSVWAVRSLPALFGVLAIPALFGLGWLAFQSCRVGHLAAALMAISPFGVYLAQEARHYTLAVLWVIASLACLAIAIRRIQQRLPLSPGLGVSWVVVNSLGMATHYFFVLSLCAEAFVLLGIVLRQSQLKGQPAVWRWIGAVTAGTLIGILVWLPSLHRSYENELTQWIWRDEHGGLAWLDPILNGLASSIGMIILLPIQNVPLVIRLISGVLLIGLSLWGIRMIVRGLRIQMRAPLQRWAIGGLGGFTAGVIGLEFLLDYGIGTDLTRSFRYAFVHFPAVILLVAAGFAPHWSNLSGNQASGFSKQIGKAAIAVILLIGLLGGLTVSFNLGYQKVQQPNLVTYKIQEFSQAPVLVAIAHRTHGQTGRLMGIAWQLKHTHPQAQFYLDHQACNPKTTEGCNIPTAQFRQTLTDLPRPFDLWLINFQGTADLSSQRCALDTALKTQRAGDYKFQRYDCSAA
jgi:uncharacterized membrane protein